MAEQTPRQMQIHKVYLKDCSVESPNAPAIFSEPGEPQFKLDLGVGHTAVGDNRYEVVVTLSAKATAGDKTLFLIEIHQAGLFDMVGFDANEIEPVLSIWGATQLFPYAREAVSSLAGHAGFPPVMLPPVNFEQFYEQRKQANAEQAAAATGATPDATH